MVVLMILTLFSLLYIVVVKVIFLLVVVVVVVVVVMMVVVDIFTEIFSLSAYCNAEYLLMLATGATKVSVPSLLRIPTVYKPSA